jgi:PAS domain S-box-containing protein
MNILVVDDHEQNRYQLQVLLAGNGHAVGTAANGDEALEKARQHPPDLIITDILMPVMDGFSLCREWKGDERLRQIPLVFYTAAYTDEKDREFALNLGAARFIVKPEEPDAFLQMIEAVIGDQRHGDLVAPRKPPQEEAVYLKEYNEAPVRKLEDKKEQLEQTNRELERDPTEGKRAEEALRETEIRFRELVDHINSGVAVYEAIENGTDFVFKDLNRAGQRIEQTSKQNVLGRRVTEVFPGVREMGLLEVFQRVWRTGQPEHHPVTLCSDERIVWRGDYVYRLPSGEVVAVYDDVIVRKRAAKDILSLARFPNENPGPVLRVARNGQLLYANQSSQRLLGHWHCTQAGQSLPEPECGWIAEALERGSGQYQEVTCGEVLYSLELTPILEMGYVNIYGHDITEQRRAATALQEGEEQFRLLVENAPDAIFIQTQGRFVYLNPIAVKYFGAESADQLLNQPVMDRVDARFREQAKERIHVVNEEKKRFPLAAQIYLKVDGAPFDVEGSTVPVHWGGHHGALVFFRDITERKRVEKDLLASHEQLRALAARIEQVREEESTSLARELHDELGQGLTALQIDLACLDRRLRITGPVDLPGLRDKIAAMVPRAERLVETTHTISSKMRPGVLDDLGLVAAVEWLAADFEKRTGLACVATLPAVDIALDLALAVALFRIVQEALTNVARHAKASRAEIRLQATEGEMVLDVEDNGCGITPQQVVETRSLGLLSMRERAAAFGGTVDVRSEGGRGTTVSVRVPRA